MAYDGTLKFDTSMDSSGFQKDASKLGDIVKGLAVFKILEKGFQAITASIDQAVSRYDTLNRFPKVMQQMGYSAESADASISKLADGIQGLPTTLDGIVGSTQRLAIATGDLDKGTDSALALNNAFYASGATTEAASRGMEQYIQALSRNKMEMQEWKVLQETMPYALKMTAEAFGFVGTNAVPQFYNALTNGEITMTEFNNKLIELNGGVGGFAEVAKTATGGIGTAFTNMGTRIAAGVTEVIAGIDRGFSQTRFKSIENIISSTGTAIKNILTSLAGAFEFVARNIEPLTAGVIAFSVAWKGTQLLSYVGQLGSLTKALAAMHPKIVAATAAKLADTKATMSAAGQQILLTTAIIAESVAKGANTVATNLSTAADNGNVLAKIALAVATKVAAAATWLFNAALAANPIGLVIVAVVALTAAIVGLVAWLSNSSAEYKKQKEEVKALTEAQEALAASTEESADAYKSNAAEIAATGKVAKSLVGTLKDVSSSTDSASEKHRKMSGTVDQLNAAVDGLNIAYDEETGAIRNINTGQEISIEQLEELVSAKAELAQANAWQERANELVQEQVKIQEELAVIEAKKQEIMANSNLTGRERRRLIKDLDEAAEGHATTMADVGMRLDIVNENIAASNTATVESVVSDYERMEQAMTENGESIDEVAQRWGVSVESIMAAWTKAGGSFDEFVTSQDEGLAEYQESVASHTKEVINSFKKIPAEYEMSAQEMIDTLRTNRERYAEWKQAMVEISGQVSAETLAELEKLGPGALSAINEMRENGGEGLRAFDEEIRATVSESTGYAAEVYNDPAFTGAPAAAFDTAAGLVDESTALPVAVTAQMEGALAAAEAVDFSAVGQNIAADLVNGLNSADVAGAMQGITAAITNNTGRVTFAASNMSAQVQTILRTMKTQAAGVATQMMTEINSAIVTRTGTVRASSAALANGVVGALAHVVSSAVSVINRMMDGMLVAMDRKAQQLYDKAWEIANRIASIMASALDVHSPSRVMIRLFENVMLGIYVAMDGMSGMLYREAESIADGIAERLTISPDVADALVERMRAVTDHTALGGSSLVPQLAYAGAGGGTRYVTNLIQNITTPKPLSPSEMTREGQDLLRRSRWQLP